MSPALALLVSVLLPFAAAAAKEPPAVKRTAPGKYRVQRSYLDGLEKDVSKVLQQARAVPHFEQGAMVGYKLTQISKGSIYDRLELRNGDVILSINGTSLDSAMKAFSAVAGLKGKTRMELKLKRGEKVLGRRYDVAN